MATNGIDNNKDNEGNLVTTETDMMFELFANEDKLVSEENMKQFDKDQLSDIKENYDNKQESISDFYDDDSNNEYTNNNENTQKYNDSYDNNSYNNNSNNNNYNNNNSYQEENEDMMLKKLNMLRKLGELTQYGVKLSQNYNMNSDYQAMEYEYELHKGIRAKRNSINWMSSMMLNCIYGLEMANEKYDPFSIKLKGWSEQMNADIKDYYDVFGELYEKYNKPGKSVPPELKLVLMISGSALKFHLTNQMLGSLPNLNNQMNQHPELAEKLRQQAMMDNIRQQQQQKREAFDKAMNDQHELAAKRASDIQMLKKQKEEFNRIRQEQQDLINKKNKLSELKKSLSSNNEINEQYQIPKLQSQLSNNYGVNNSSTQIQNTELQRLTQIKKQFDKMNNNKSETSHIDDKTSEDSISIGNTVSKEDLEDDSENSMVKVKKKNKKNTKKLKINTD